MRLLLALVLMFAATVADACTCAAVQSQQAKFLDMRVGSADRVVLVRVVGARLRPRDLDEHALPWPLDIADSDLVYEMETVEVLKGSARSSSLPVLESNSSNCAQPLRPGDFLVLYLRNGDRELSSSICTQHEAERLGPWGGTAELRLAAIRALVRDGTKPHACDNDWLPAEELRAECERRRRDAQVRWIERIRLSKN